MRQQIALQLHNASNHVYTVDQETVTADEKERTFVCVSRRQVKKGQSNLSLAKDGLAENSGAPNKNSRLS